MQTPSVTTGILWATGFLVFVSCAFSEEDGNGGASSKRHTECGSEFRRFLAKRLTTDDIGLLRAALCEEDIVARRIAFRALLRAPRDWEVTQAALYCAATNSDRFIRETASREIVASYYPNMRLRDILSARAALPRVGGSALPGRRPQIVDTELQLSKFCRDGGLSWYVPSETDRPALVEMAQDPTNETGVRLLAAWLLMELGDDVGKECARKHIRAGTPEAIAEALTLLTVDRPYSVAAAPPWRVRLVLDSVKLEAFEDVDSVSLERIHLPEWLAQNCHEGVVLTLRELLRCGDGIDRARLAARTLAEIQDQTAIPLILERLGNTYDAQFIEALGLLKAGAAFPVLEKLLFSPVQKAPAESPEVVKRMYCEGQRPNIIDAMLRISPDRTMGVLKRFVQQDNEPEGIWYARAKIVALRTKDREQLLHELRQLLANPHMTPAGRRQVRRAMRGDPH